VYQKESDKMRGEERKEIGKMMQKEDKVTYCMILGSMFMQ
jgi:2-keto-3-deoxy-galactonokinase